MPRPGAPPTAVDEDEAELARGSGCAPTAATALDDDFFSSLCATPAPAAPSQDRRRSASRLAGTRAVAPRPRPRPPSAAAAAARPHAPASPPPTAAAATGIRKMSGGCAKAVRMGQAVLDAAAVVKELVENSLDAGATRVDVQLQGKAGCERITVSDNGSGIGAASRAALCRPHATSKLASFSDLDAISTFGFRGEAMSAIAELCEKVTVTTRTSDDRVGACLVYCSDGEVLRETRAARRAGTTIQVERLFARLPVRLQDAEKHSSRDIARCLAVMQSYALTATRVRFELRVGADARLLTQPRPGATPTDALHAAISAVLGRKQAEVMVPCGDVDLATLTSGRGGSEYADATGDLVDTDHATGEGETGLQGYSVSGFVSKSNHAGSGGGGRLSGSWQFFYLNGRPVDMPRVARAINESYRRFALNSHASPTFVLSFSVPQGMFDVNLSPDKRQVMIHREPALIEALQRHLEALWSPLESRAIPVDDKPPPGLSSPAASISPPDLNVPGDVATKDVICPPVNGSGDEVMNKRRSLDLLVSARKRPRSSTLLDFVNLRGANARAQDESRSQALGGVGSTRSNGPARSTASSGFRSPASDSACEFPDLLSGPRSPPCGKPTAAREAQRNRVVSENQSLRRERALLVASDGGRDDDGRSRGGEPVAQISFSLPGVVAERSRRRKERRDIALGSQRLGARRMPLYSCSVTVKQPLLDCSQGSFSEETDAEREAAEQELSRVFKQSWFRDLKVLGQFNKGFIVCLLHEKDLFIVDQHASDEKFNFEDLENNTVIETQRLIRPMSLDLAADEELLVLDNLALFKRSGFDIQHRPSRPPTQRLYLLSQPSSKRTMFVVDDLREMISSLQESSSHATKSTHILRPRRVRAMFASRACRKSVMIGTTLTKQIMERLVCQLETLVHPWSCPHGRPTMRHLVDIERLEKSSNSDS